MAVLHKFYCTHLLRKIQYLPIAHVPALSKNPALHSQVPPTHEALGSPQESDAVVEQLPPTGASAIKK